MGYIIAYLAGGFMGVLIMALCRRTGQLEKELEMYRKGYNEGKADGAYRMEV